MLNIQLILSDTFHLYNCEESRTHVDISSEGIAWPFERESKFQNPCDFHYKRGT